MIIGRFDPFKMESYGVVAADGTAVDGAKLPPDDLLRQFFRDMALIRAADDRAFSLQRQGRLGTYPQLKGNEAIQVGCHHALGPDDWIVPSYREQGLAHLRGVPLSNIFLYWAGSEEGSRYPAGVRVLPIAIPVGSQTLHAVGLGLAARMRGDPVVIATFFGDGATSEGEFHEAMNFAGVFGAPVVFVCCNNQFAISLGRERQSRSATIAQKAAAYGFDGIAVDGMDVVAVYDVVSEAVERARAGGGPTLVEAVTYRLCDHTTADDASIYRDKAELERWREKDPFLRMKRLLESKGLWSPADDEALKAEVKGAVDDGVARFEAAPQQEPINLFGDTYATLPEQLKWQIKDMKGKG